MRDWFGRNRHRDERRWQPSRDFRNMDARNYDDWREDGTPWDEHPQGLNEEPSDYRGREMPPRDLDFNNYGFPSYTDYMEASWRRRHGLDPWIEDERTYPENDFDRGRVGPPRRHERGHWDY